MFLILIVVVHSFPSVLYLTFPLLSLRWWVNRDHVDGFLSCNNQSKRREEDCRGLEQLHISFESECPRKEKSLPLTWHFHVLLLCETIDQRALWVCPCCWANMVQLQFWWFSCFYLNWRMFCASAVWEYFIFNGHNFRIPDHQFANEADFLNS